MRLHQLAASTVLVLLQLSAAAAQEWPTRHITEIVPFGKYKNQPIELMLAD